MTPIIEAPGFVERVGRHELPPQALPERGLDMAIGRARMMCFVVQLIADDRSVVPEAGDKLADDALGVPPIDGMGQVGHLPQPVGVAGQARLLDLDLGMLLEQPGRDGIGRRAQDDLDAGPVGPVEDAPQPIEVEAAVARLEDPPGRLPYPDEADPGFLHQLEILLQPLGGHVFPVIRSPVKDGIEFGRLGPESGGGQNGQDRNGYAGHRAQRTRSHGTPPSPSLIKAARASYIVPAVMAAVTRRTVTGTPSRR